MRGSRLLDKAAAVARRDLLTAIRYRRSFLFTAIGTGAELATFYYLSKALGPSFRAEGLEYFPFVLVGTGFYSFLISGSSQFLYTVQLAQQTGTLEVLVTTATPAPVLLFLSAMSTFSGATLQLFFYLGAGLLLLGSTLHLNLAACVVVFLLSLIVAIAVGLIAAALQLAIQKGSAVVWLLGSTSWLMTGALFPISTLPKPFWWAGQLIPLTHSLNAMRRALFEGAGFRALGNEIGILVLFCAVLLPASLVAFSFALRRARMAGTLSFY
ncbi:MAG TPA: ABC transporter permease [Terriglobales bacterium]|nr:ABC transporter permease [Terriglobales bacterium]